MKLKIFLKNAIKFLGEPTGFFVSLKFFYRKSQSLLKNLQILYWK